jgi:CRP/FNR family cyclic AMP-dependent transcriptional regulator
MSRPTAREKLELIEGHALLGSLPKADLSTLISRAHVQHFRAGEQIFAKGSPGRSMMAILHGNVRITATSSASREFVLTTLHAGEIFGEIALIDGHARTADANALTDCDLLVLDRREFLPFLERRPDLCILLLRIFCHRLRHTNQQIEHAVFDRIDTRLAKTLVGLVRDTLVKSTPASTVITLQTSQRDLAGIVGTTRESINKHLHAWKRAGIVDLGKRLIIILDMEAIEALA